MIDTFNYNRKAWDLEVEKGNEWTQPVSSAVIAEARQGRWQIILTPTKPVPQDWFPALPGADVLCLASGGGQQGPVLAAAGANVTVLDASPRQLEQDLRVAERDCLKLRTVEGDVVEMEWFYATVWNVLAIASHPNTRFGLPQSNGFYQADQENVQFRAVYEEAAEDRVRAVGWQALFDYVLVFRRRSGGGIA